MITLLFALQAVLADFPAWIEVERSGTVGDITSEKVQICRAEKDCLWVARKRLANSKTVKPGDIAKVRIPFNEILASEEVPLGKGPSN